MPNKPTLVDFFKYHFQPGHISAHLLQALSARERQAVNFASETIFPPFDILANLRVLGRADEVIE